MHLHVLGQTESHDLDPTHAALAQAFASRLRGSVRFGKHDRMLYATDASMYQIEPIGVVVPVDEEDVVRAVELCDEQSIAMLPRGGGTSLAGQCTNHAIVIDTSARMRAITDLQAGEDGGTVHAQAGVVLDTLNAELATRKTGLFFPPDPATVAQATIGGCIGNNAAGSRSVMYGRTVDSVLEIDAVLANGARVRFGPGAGARDPIALKLADGVSRIVRAHAKLIRERYPKTLRRNAGYALDLILDQLDAGVSAQELDLTNLLCGSEGTLAITLGAKLKLWKAPTVKGLALMSFATVDAAIAATMPALTTGPSAVELIDDVVIEAALNNIECREYVKAFPSVNGQSPRGVLYIEYQCYSAAELDEKLAQLQRVLGSHPIRIVRDAAGMGDAWKLRKAGEPLLHGLPGHRKPITFVEDNAVPVEKLGEFVREFRAIVERAGTRAAFWAHASVGVLHVRPMIDPHDPKDLQTLKSIAVEVADLARRCGGVMSGEHGDGKVRGPLLERFYGRELCEAFAQVKRLFDPKGLLNPGNIVGAGSVDSIVERTRIEPVREASEPLGSKQRKIGPIATYYAYDDHEGFAHAVERCNGAGVCRKTSGGTMCPSYRGTLDERHATRGRGNALRLAISGQLNTDGSSKPKWDDEETIKTLDLCLGCKACKSECPSNVDIARLKAEYTAQRFKATGRIPLAAQITGHVRWLNKLGAMTPGLANWFNSTPIARALINAVMKMHPKRSMPKFSRSLYAELGHRDGSLAGAKPGALRVAIYADCFTTYNESRIGLAMDSVVRKLGYAVDLPRVGCCGRSMISMGMLEQAIEQIDRTIEQLRPSIEDENVRAIVFAEPSCLSAVKDDWLTLKCASSIELRKQLAAKAMLVEDFVDRYWDQHPAGAVKVRREALPKQAILHAHCHQKALWGGATSARVLRRLLGDALATPDTGCCGMCGAFGYDRDKYELSMKIGNLSGKGEPGGGILPIARGADAQAVIVAPGTSCRHQIKDGAEREAIHPIELVDRMIE